MKNKQTKYALVDKVTGLIRLWIDFSAFNYSEKFNKEELIPVTEGEWKQKDTKKFHVNCGKLAVDKNAEASDEQQQPERVVNHDC